MKCKRKNIVIRNSGIELTCKEFRKAQMRYRKKHTYYNKRSHKLFIRTD